MIAEEQEEVTQDEELLDEGEGEEEGEGEAEEFIQNSYESNYMKLPLHHRVNNILNTVGYTLKFHTCHTLPRIFYPSKYVCRPLTTKEWKWNPENQGLYVIIHGLLGTPRTTPYSIANAIDAKSPNRFEIKLPRVPYRGNRDLAVCSEPILDMVKSYIAENPNKPIHLIGTSNGARIVSYIETRLRDQPVTIRVTSIAGAYYGSRILNQLNKYAGPVTGLILSRDLRKNLSVGSDECKDLILEMQKPVNIGTRIYEFYGTANDWYIPNIDSCFPILTNVVAVYHPLKVGVDHISMGHSIADEIVDNSLKWMDSIINHSEFKEVANPEIISESMIDYDLKESSTLDS